MQRLVAFGVRPASSNLRIRTIPLRSTPSFVRASSGGEKKPYRVEVTRDKVEVKFVRSSGPGGQNVNKLSTKAEVRFHVDAAWGGATLMSNNYRALLKGIELADSVTIDAHKQLYIPMGAGMVRAWAHGVKACTCVVLLPEGSRIHAFGRCRCRGAAAG